MVGKAAELGHGVGGGGMPFRARKGGDGYSSLDHVFGI